HLAEELRVRQLSPVALRLPLPVEGDTVAVPRLDVLVEAVPRDVERAAEEPLRVREVPLDHRRERLEPADTLLRLALPERLQVLVVDRGLRVRLGGEGGRRRIAALLEEERVDVAGLGLHGR